MTGTMDHGAYGAPGWDASGWQGGYRHRPPWERGGWGGPPFLHGPFGHRALWIGATVLGFIAWWPIGLAMLFFTLGSKRMGCWGLGGAGRWAGGEAGGMGGRGGHCGRGGAERATSSGNRAFDEYRAETLRRLEEEQQEFSTFLDRLRFAKDKAEFDAFMAERRERPPTPPEPSQGPTPE